MSKWIWRSGVTFEACDIAQEIDYSMGPMNEYDVFMGLWHIEIGTRPPRCVFASAFH